MFENKVFEDIHYSRFIASWMKTRGKVNADFKDWLSSLVVNGKHIPDEVVQDIYNLGTNGKLELETSAKLFKGTTNSKW